MIHNIKVLTYYIYKYFSKKLSSSCYEYMDIGTKKHIEFQEIVKRGPFHPKLYIF